MKESALVRRVLPALAAVLLLGLPATAQAASTSSSSTIAPGSSTIAAGSSTVPTTPPTSAATTTATPASTAVSRTSTTAASGVIAADAWILVDADTGAVLAGRSIHVAHLTASTVKTVTALTALRVLGPNALVQVSSVAASRSPMKIGMVAGDQWSMHQTLYALLLVSANDAAYALAQSASGSIEGFAKAMTATGTALGLQDSTFRDPAGFDGTDSVIGPSKMSAFDLAVVARAILHNEVLAPIVATRTFDMVTPDGLPHHLVNHSRLLTLYPGANGVKTGWTRAANGTFVGSATRNGRTLIAVVLGAGDIYQPVIRLFDYGFSQPASDRGTGAVLPPLLTASPPSTTPSTAAETTVPTTVPAQLGPAPAPVTTAPNKAPAGPAWLSLMGGGFALVVACVALWRLAVSTSRRRRYDRVLGRVAELEVSRG